MGLVAASVVALALVVFTREAARLSPALAKILVQQLQVALGDGHLFAHPGDPLPLPRALQMLWLGPATTAEALFTLALRRLTGTVAALTAQRAFQVALFETGAPLLLVAARRRGLPRGEAMALALLYALQPVVLTKLAWDTVLPAAPLVILAYLGWLQRRFGHFAAGLLLAAATHPFAFAGAALLTVWLGRGETDPRARRALGRTRVALLALGTVTVSGVVLPGLLWPHGPTLAGALTHGRTLVGLVREPAGRLLGILGTNAAAIGLLVLAAGGGLLRRPGMIWVVALDLGYALFSYQGLDHGLVGATFGLLVVLCVEAAATRPGPGVRWLLGAGALAVAVGWGVAGPRSLLAQLGNPAPPPALAELTAAPLPALAGPCAVEATLVPYVLDRCPGARAYGDGAQGDRQARPPPAFVVLSPARLTAPAAAWPRGYQELRRLDRDRRALGRIRAAIAAGHLGLVRVAGPLVVLGRDRGRPVPPWIPAALDRVLQTAPADWAAGPPPGRGPEVTRRTPAPGAPPRAGSAPPPSGAPAPGARTPPGAPRARCPDAVPPRPAAAGPGPAPAPRLGRCRSAAPGS